MGFLVKIHPLQKMPPIDSQHVGVDLGTIDGFMAQELADVFQGPAMQQQMDGKRVPERMAAEGKGRAPYPLHQRMDVPVHRLPRHRKDPLPFSETPRIQVTLDPILQQQVHNGHIALRRALQGRLAGSPRPLFQGLEDHAEVIADIDEARRGEGQHLGDPRPGGPHQIEDQPDRSDAFRHPAAR